MTFGRGWMAGAVVMALAVVACSSSSSGGSTGSGNACTQGGASDTCYSCAQSKCGSYLTGYERDCSAYIACSCPGGTYSMTAANSSMCIATITETCNSTDVGYRSCTTMNCTSACSGGTGDGG